MHTFANVQARQWKKKIKKKQEQNVPSKFCTYKTIHMFFYFVLTLLTPFLSTNSTACKQTSCASLLIHFVLVFSNTRPPLVYFLPFPARSSPDSFPFYFIFISIQTLNQIPLFLPLPFLTYYFFSNNNIYIYFHFLLPALNHRPFSLNIHYSTSSITLFLQTLSFSYCFLIYTICPSPSVVHCPLFTFHQSILLSPHHCNHATPYRLPLCQTAPLNPCASPIS